MVSKQRDSEKLTAGANVRFKEREYSEIKKQADAAKLSLSEYIRRCALDRKVTSKVDLRVLAELRNLGDLLRFSVESQGIHSEVAAETMRVITDCVKKLLEKQIQDKKGGKE